MPGDDVRNAPVLPAVPFIDLLVLADAHGAVEEQRSADKVESAEFNTADKIKEDHPLIRAFLKREKDPRSLKVPCPELVVPQRHNRREPGRKKQTADIPPTG